MIVGLGTDLVEVERVRRSIARFGTRFLERIYTAEEIAYCRGKRDGTASFAARFAAKEAGAKALGTGISRGVSWQDLAVSRRPGEAPELRFSGRAGKRAAHLGVRHIALSLTHTGTLAMAVVVLEN